MADSRPAYSSAAPGTLQFPALQSQLTVSNIKMLWPVFQPLFLSYCGSLGAYQFQGGVLATWLSPETFLARIGVAAADVIPADPGPSAAAPDLAVWKTESAQFTKYVELVEASGRIWAAYVHSSLTVGLGDAVFGLQGVTPRQQYAHVVQIYGDVDPAFVQALYVELNQLQRRRTLEDFLHQATILFSMRASMHAPVGEWDRLQLLKTAFGWGHFADRIAHYLRDHPHHPRVPAVVGDQSYDALVIALRSEDTLHRQISLPSHFMLSATDQGPAPDLALSATPAATSTGTHAEFLALQAQVASMAKQLSSRPAVSAARQRPTGPFAGPFLYCWTHGYHDHLSTTCNRQATGHKTASTSANKMGGATFKWTALTEDQRKQARTSGPSGVV